MIWSNLKINKCPKCNRDFVKGLETQILANGRDKMLVHYCGFQIRESRYSQIVTSQVIVDLDRQGEEVIEDER